MPQSARPCPVSKTRLDRVARVSDLLARGAAQLGATRRISLLRREFTRSKPFQRKRKLNDTTPAGYDCNSGAKTRALLPQMAQIRSQSETPVSTPQAQIDSDF